MHTTASVIILGPPNSGKSARAEQLAKRLGFRHIEVSDLLKNTNDEEIRQVMRAGELVSDQKVQGLLRDEIFSKPSVSNVICGCARTAKQAETLLSLLNNFRHRVIVVNGIRSYGECNALRLIRQVSQCRADDTTAVFDHRYMKYRINIAQVSRYFQAHLHRAHSMLQFNFTDDIAEDVQGLYSLIRPHDNEHLSVEDSSQQAVAV